MQSFCLLAIIFLLFYFYQLIDPGKTIAHSNRPLSNVNGTYFYYTYTIMSTVRLTYASEYCSVKMGKRHQSTFLCIFLSYVSGKRLVKENYFQL